MRTAEELKAFVTLRKVGDMLLAYVPVLVCLCLSVYAVLRGLGYQAHNVISFFTCSGMMWAPYIWISSLSRGFCKLHRRVIVYDLSVALFMYVELWTGFAPRVRFWIDVALAFWGFGLVGHVLMRIAKRGFYASPWAHTC